MPKTKTGSFHEASDGLPRRGTLRATAPRRRHLRRQSQGQCRGGGQATGSIIGQNTDGVDWSSCKRITRLLLTEGLSENGFWCSGRSPSKWGVPSGLQPAPCTVREFRDPLGPPLVHTVSVLSPVTANHASRGCRAGDPHAARGHSLPPRIRIDLSPSAHRPRGSLPRSRKPG